MEEADAYSGHVLTGRFLTHRIGYEGETFKGKLNVGLTCWQLVNATIIALYIPRLRRRPTYLTCASLLLTIYVAWTIAMERVITIESKAAGHFVIFVMFAYSPCYNIGYNALTYSKSALRLGRLSLLADIGGVQLSSSSSSPSPSDREVSPSSSSSAAAPDSSTPSSTRSA